jgi:RNase P subunit RPR2
MAHLQTCSVCGHVIVAAKNHDVRSDAAARLFPSQTCKECGKPARVRCCNGPGTYWVECDGGHRYSTG